MCLWQKLYREPELVALTIDFSTTTGAMVCLPPCVVGLAMPACPPRGAGGVFAHRRRNCRGRHVPIRATANRQGVPYLPRGCEPVAGTAAAARSLCLVVSVLVRVPGELTNTRLQVAFLVLQGLMRKVGNHMHNVVAPHGAETGFDPHAGYTNVNGENYYEFTHGAMLGPQAPSEWQHRWVGGGAGCIAGV